MTKPFNVWNTCQHCGKQTSAETGFGRWMRNHPELRSNIAHIVRTDTDHTILRYKTHYQGRDFQLMMCIEVKEFGAKPDPAQKDILRFQHEFLMHTSRNKHKALTFRSKSIYSEMLKRVVRLRHYGFHLLQFEKTSPEDSAWIKWDHREIAIDTLVGLLAMDVHPWNLRPMDEFLRDRHWQSKNQDCLFDAGQM